MSDKESSVLKENRWRLKIKKHLRLEGVIEGDRRMGTFSLWPCAWWHRFGLGCLRRHLPGKRETHKMNSDSFLPFSLWPRGLWGLSSPARDWICAPQSESSGMPGNSLSCSFLSQLLKWKPEDFPGGAVDKSVPANAGDTGLIPDLGRFHRPWSNQASAPQQLSLCAETAEALWPTAHTRPQEKPLQWEAHTPQWRVAAARESLHTATKTQHNQKIKKKKSQTGVGVWWGMGTVNDWRKGQSHWNHY